MNTNILTYRTIIEKDDDAYHGFVPALPGCHTSGDTVEETRQNLRKAISLWLESRLAHNLPIPKEESFESIETVNLDSLSPSKSSFRYA